MSENESITTRADFIKFLAELSEDYQNNVKGWENATLEQFLNALQAYSQDIDGYYKNMNLAVDPDQASWRVFADMLAGARVYE